MLSNNYNHILDDNTKLLNDPSGLEGNKTINPVKSISSSLSPPPYSPPSTKNSIQAEISDFDNVLYKKMISLESMISDIHNSVIDNSSSYKDISTQLSEINESMKNFHDEASIRIRKEFSENKKLDSLFLGQPDNESSSVSSMQNNSTDEGDKDFCYDRVCNLVETLISDANSVLDASSTPTFNSDIEESDQESTSNNPKIHNNLFPSDSLVLDMRKNKTIHAPEIEHFFQVSRGNSLTRHRGLSKKMFLPLLKDAEDIDLERLALISAPTISEDFRQNLAALQVSQTEFEKFLLDENLSQLLISLIYWVVMFTLGSLLFDSSLCNTAGVQILNILKVFSKQRNNQRRRSLSVRAIEGPIGSTQCSCPQISNQIFVFQRRKSI